MQFRRSALSPVRFFTARAIATRALATRAVTASVLMLAALLTGMSAGASPGHAADRSLTSRLFGERVAEGASAWDKAMTSSLRLIAARTGSTPLPGEAAIAAGVEITLAPGWKTYWRNPGDSGIAPVFDFSRSRNVAAVEVAYPMPQRFELPGDISFGYEDRVVFPLSVTPADPSRPVTLTADVVYGACEELCIPVEASAELDLPARSGGATEFAGLIARWQAMVPADHEARVEAADIVTRDGQDWLHLRVSASAPLAAPVLIAEPMSGDEGGMGTLYLGPLDMTYEGDAAEFMLPAKPLRDAQGLAQTGGSFRITLADLGPMPDGAMKPVWAQQFELHLPPRDGSGSH